MKKIVLAILLLTGHFCQASEHGEMEQDKYQNNVVVNLSSILLVNMASINYE